jgi:hypothetical protein
LVEEAWELDDVGAVFFERLLRQSPVVVELQGL